MVAFGKKLAAAAAEAPFDAAHYLDYESLKALLYDLQPLHLRHLRIETGYVLVANMSCPWHLRRHESSKSHV